MEPAIVSSELPHVMIFGTRTFNDYDLLKQRMELYTAELGEIVVCTGEWRGIGYGEPDYIGADLLGEQWAHSHRYLVKRFQPDFKLGSPACFHVRNREMVEFVASVKEGYAVCFWDGDSPGTWSVIQLCRNHGVPLKKVIYQ
jgi:hypothetical protein